VSLTADVRRDYLRSNDFEQGIVCHKEFKLEGGQTCLLFVQDTGSVDVQVAKRRVSTSEVAKLVIGEGDADVAPVLVLWRQVARPTTHVDVSSLDHAVRQRVVDLVAAPVER